MNAFLTAKTTVWGPRSGFLLFFTAYNTCRVWLVQAIKTRFPRTTPYDAIRVLPPRDSDDPNVKIAQRSAHRDRLRGAICASQIKTARSSDAAVRCRSRASRRRGHVHHRQVVNDNLSSWGQPSSWRHRAVVISHLRSLRERSWSLGRQVFHGCVDLGLDIRWQRKCAQRSVHCMH